MTSASVSSTFSVSNCFSMNRMADGAHVHGDLLDLPGALGFSDGHGVGPDRDDFRGAGEGQVHEDLPAVHGPRGRHIAALDPQGDAVHGQGRRQPCRQARGELFALGRGADEDHAGGDLLNQVACHVGIGVQSIFLESRIVGRPYRVGPVGAEQAGRGSDAVAHDEGVDPAAQGRRRLLSLTQRLVCHLAESAFDLLCDDQYSCCHSFFS